jgi:hypothetical protein
MARSYTAKQIFSKLTFTEVVNYTIDIRGVADMIGVLSITPQLLLCNEIISMNNNTWVCIGLHGCRGSILEQEIKLPNALTHICMYASSLQIPCSLESCLQKEPS